MERRKELIDKIIGSYKYIVDHLKMCDIQSICNHLYSKKIFSKNAIDEILSEKTTLEKAMKLVDNIIKCDEMYINCFLDSIQDIMPTLYQKITGKPGIGLNH